MHVDYRENFDYIVRCLNEQPDLWSKIESSTTSLDGADVAKEGEDIVIQAIIAVQSTLPNVMDILPSAKSERRPGYDFTMGPIFANIKMDAAGGNNDAGGKMAVMIACTGRPCNNNLHWPNFLKLLKAGYDDPSEFLEDLDYVYLVCDRTNKKFFWRALRDIKELASHATNLPFQINWKNNQEPFNRSLDEARRYILSTLRDSFYKGNERLVEFDNSFPEL